MEFYRYPYRYFGSEAIPMFGYVKRLLNNPSDADRKLSIDRGLMWVNNDFVNAVCAITVTFWHLP